MEELEIGAFKIRINNRKILDVVLSYCNVSNDKIRAISAAVDKMDKREWNEVKTEMIEKGISESDAENIKQFSEINGNPNQVLSILENDNRINQFEKFKQALNEMKLLIQFLEAYNCLQFVTFDMAMVRGLDYYTGFF